MLDQVRADHRVAVDAVVVLGGDQNGLEADRLAVDVVEGDLGLGVGPQVRDGAGPANLGMALGHAMSQMDRQRHQDVGLVAGVAEHHALVACALLVVGVAAGRTAANLFGLVDALGDIGRLLVDGHHHATGLAVEAVGLGVVTDPGDRLTHHRWDVDVCRGGDLAGHDGQTGRHHGLAGDAAVGILLEEGVEDGIGNLIGHLVRMAFGHRFRGESKAVGHCHLPSMLGNRSTAASSTALAIAVLSFKETSRTEPSEPKIVTAFVS